MATVTSKKIVKSARMVAIDKLIATRVTDLKTNRAAYLSNLVLVDVAKSVKANINEYIADFNVKFPHKSRDEFTAKLATFNAQIKVARDAGIESVAVLLETQRDVEIKRHNSSMKNSKANAAKQKAARLARKASAVKVTKPLSDEIIAQINEAGYVAA